MLIRIIVIYVGYILYLSAVPALSIEREYQQIDGSSFRGTLRGDEFFYWIELLDNNISIYSESSGLYEYGEIKNENLMPSGISVTPVQSSPSSSTSKDPILVPKIDKKKLYKIWDKKRKNKGVR